MSKIHIAANIAKEGKPLFARCASKSVGNGKVRRNSRSTYGYMASEIVDSATFRATPAKDRCAHCEAKALEGRNKVRAKKGLRLATYLNEIIE